MVVLGSFSLSLAGILLGGYLVFRAFASVRLPGAVGVIIFGVVLGPYADPTLVKALPFFKEMAFLLVLCRAGCETQMSEINRTVVLLGSIPVIAEMVGIALVLTATQEGMTMTQGLLAGSMMASLGDGLLLPILNELHTIPGLGPLPRVMACVAPIEASLALFLYAILASLGTTSTVSFWWRLFFAFVKMVASIGIGVLVGWLVALFCKNSMRPSVFGRKVFAGTQPEEFLVLLGAALFVYGLCGEDEHHNALVPNGMHLLGTDPSTERQEPLMLPELGLICVTFFCAYFSPHVAHNADTLFKGLWVFAGLFLFSSIGVGIKDIPGKVKIMTVLLPALACGLVGRFASVLAICAATARSRQKQGGGAAGKGAWPGMRHVALESAFCFACGLPRATIQGVLSSRPYALGIYPGVMVAGYELAGKDGLLSTLAQATLLIMAPCGQLALTFSAQPILTRTVYPPILTRTVHPPSGIDVEQTHTETETQSVGGGLLPHLRASREALIRALAVLSDGSAQLIPKLFHVRVFRAWYAPPASRPRGAQGASVGVSRV